MRESANDRVLTTEKVVAAAAAAAAVAAVVGLFHTKNNANIPGAHYWLTL